MFSIGPNLGVAPFNPKLIDISGMTLGALFSCFTFKTRNPFSSLKPGFWLLCCWVFVGCLWFITLDIEKDDGSYNWAYCIEELPLVKDFIASFCFWARASRLIFLLVNCREGFLPILLWLWDWFEKNWSLSWIRSFLSFLMMDCRDFWSFLSWSSILNSGYGWSL